MRLIDASPLEEGGYKLERRYIHNGCEVIEGMSVSCVPTVDAEVVRHGKWIDTGEIYTDMYTADEDPLYKCSLCGEVLIGKPSWDFCPWCGARMDG